MTATSQLQQIRDQRNALSKQIHEQGKELFNESARGLFAKHPKLESFSWTQYTPYFNDGDSCTFGVNSGSLYVKFNEKEFEELSTWTFRSERTYNQEARQEAGLKEAYADIRDLLTTFEDADYELMFGDHVKVTVKAPGVTETNDYPHD